MNDVKTNTMRLLDVAGINYDKMTYEIPDEEFSGHAVASILNLDEGQTFKTLVAKGDKTGYLVCCIPVSCELDLKSIASVSGNKKVEMVPVKDILPLTGYIRGGVCPIGMKKKFPTYIDETCVLYDRIAISAGVKGCQLILNPDDLINYAEITVSAIAF